MNVWILLQTACNLIFLSGLIAAWARLKRPPQDDPRLSRGLQLLQTKITVLEDLSDRTDAQVKQLTALLDQKSRLLQSKILEAEQQIMKIDHSMTKSLEVAEIFQDKIPHQEVLERQQKTEYVRAARLAHSGATVEEISAQVSLPREQVELIAKFNRERLMFDEDRLPEWANRAVERDQGAGHFQLGSIDFLGTMETPSHDEASIQRMDQDLKSAVAKQREEDERMLKTTKVVDSINQSGAMLSMKATAQTLKDRLVATAEDMLRQQAATQAPLVTPTGAPPLTPDTNMSPMAQAAVKNVLESQPSVRKVVFPRIET